jgi:hypothetical protein
MQLIPISEDILINPDKISVVEVKKRKAGTIVAVIVDGRTYEATVNTGTLLAELRRAGVDLSNQFFSV